MTNFLVLILLAFCFSITSCDSPAKKESTGFRKPPQLSKADIQFQEEMNAQWRETMKYQDALIIEKAEMKTNTDYLTKYHFTVKNESEETIVAFSIGTSSNCIKRFKRTIKPNTSYSSTIKLDQHSCMIQSTSLYSVQSIVLANGKQISILGEPTSRRH